MPLFSEHISNMYYSGSSYSTPYTGYSSVLPLGSSYSASYLNPGGTYSSHSSLGAYSRPPPLSSRWVTSSGRNYAPMLTPISERGTSSPVRLNSPRRLYAGKRSYTPTYTPPPRPININTADIDVSKDKYRHKAEQPAAPEPAPEADAGPFMPRVDGKPETGIDSSPGLQRSTIRRGRTVVRLHTIKRKDRDSPRKPQSELDKAAAAESSSTAESTPDDSEHLPWREKLSEDLTYKDKREKKTLGAKLVEKFIVKDKDSDSDGSFKEKKQKTEIAQSLPVSPGPSSNAAYSRSPDRRCSMELLAEQANVLDSLIKGENLSLASLDLSKVGLQEKPEATAPCQPSIKRRKSSDQNNPLQTTKSDHSLNESIRLSKSFSKKRSLKKSSSGGSICRLDSIKEFIREPIANLPVIVENSAPIKRESVKVKSKPKLKAVITSSVEVTEPISPLKFKIDVTVEDTPLPLMPKIPKKEIIYSTIVEDAPTLTDDQQTQDNILKKFSKKRIKPLSSGDVSPELEEGNFWDKIGKRETVYLMKRKQIIDENKERNRRALFWFPEEEEGIEATGNYNNNNVLERNSSLEKDNFSDACQVQPNNNIENSEQLTSIPENLTILPSVTEDVVKISELTKKEETKALNVMETLESECKTDNKLKPLQEQTETEPELDTIITSANNVDSKLSTKEDNNNLQTKDAHERIQVCEELKESSENTKSKTNQVQDIQLNATKSEKEKEAEKVANIETCPSCGGIKDIPDQGNIETVTEKSQASFVEGQELNEDEKIIKLNKIFENPDKRSKEVDKKTNSNNDTVTEKSQASLVEGQELNEDEKRLKLNKIFEDPDKSSKEVHKKTNSTKKTISLTKETEKQTEEITELKPSPGKSSPATQIKKSFDVQNKTPLLMQKNDKEKPKSTGAIPKVPLLKTKVEERAIVNKDINKEPSEKPNDNPVHKKISPVTKKPPNLINEKKTSPVGSNSKEFHNKEKTIPAKSANASPKSTEKDTKSDTILGEDGNKKPVVKEMELKSEAAEHSKAPEVSAVIEPENIPNKEEPKKIEHVQKETISEEKIPEKLPVKVEKVELQPPSQAEILKPPSSRRPVKDEPALRPLIATPRPLQKRVPQVIHSSSSSETSSEEESSDDEDADESDTSEESGEFFECENHPDGRTSTGSNDSGFDSSAPTSPAAFMHIKKGGEGAGPSAAPAPADATDLVEQELEQSTAYGLFRKTGRFTPPARSIPRFRKYTIEDFHFIKVLGKGSFGKVLLAELRDTEYYYAVKCLKKDVVLEDDDVECTLIERKVLALGTNHPYLCHLFATFQTDSHLFFVMEYLNGGDLMFHIQQSGRFPESRARFYGAEIVSGLKFLHKRGIVYRDLKLDNILLDFDGHVRIADFGMCKLQIYLEKTADTFCGTPDYMAPEIIKGLKYNQTVDWWSFGVLLYEMLIGQSPFSGCDEDELFWSICNEMPSYPRFLSQEALTILTRLLDKDARTRLGGTECMHGDVRDQDFFHQIHWDKLERRELEAPFRPRVRHPLDTQYFDRAFTGERPRLTAVEPHVLRTMDQEAFRGFSYTNPNATDR